MVERKSLKIRKAEQVFFEKWKRKCHSLLCPGYLMLTQTDLILDQILGAIHQWLQNHWSRCRNPLEVQSHYETLWTREDSHHPFGERETLHCWPRVEWIHIHFLTDLTCHLFQFNDCIYFVLLCFGLLINIYFFGIKFLGINKQWCSHSSNYSTTLIVTTTRYSVIFQKS